MMDYVGKKTKFFTIQIFLKIDIFFHLMNWEIFSEQYLESL